MSSSFGVYLKALEAKLKTSVLIADPDNVVMGDSRDILALPDTAFPRLEVLITKVKTNGYFSQRQQMFAFRYTIAGYIRRTVDEVDFDDMVTLMDWGRQVVALNYSFLDDKQAGSSPCTGFLKMGDYPETFYDFELVDRISTFLIIDMEAQIQLSDTED